MDVTNTPIISKTIIRTYIGLASFVGIMALYMVYQSFKSNEGITLLGGAFILLVLIEPLFLMVVQSIKNTRYQIINNDLVIKTENIIGGTRTINLNTITTIERTLYPVGLKLYGASFHGGYYSVPGLGRAHIAVTNLDDIVLIKTNDNNYIISPKNPESFIDLIKTRKNTE